jgi:hypothetical protein
MGRRRRPFILPFPEGEEEQEQTRNLEDDEPVDEFGLDDYDMWRLFNQVPRQRRQEPGETA